MTNPIDPSGLPVFSLRCSAWARACSSLSSQRYSCYEQTQPAIIVAEERLLAAVAALRDACHAEAG
ncbi:MAG: hypothetical protein LLG01_13455 [Planctomycetaceae bacterium]|nr:hypothetical protein [Planctomycetaceae bacterium]